jgi:adenosine deaminase
VYALESERRPPEVQPETALDVWATEYRVAPDAWFNILRHRDLEIKDGVMEESNCPESAWLIHFKRKAHDDLLPLFGTTIRQMESEADQVARALATEPTRLKTLRGIDICGVEEAQPLWVSADTLRRLRVRSRSIAGSRPGLGIVPLRLTLHVGEDFDWLTSGLRAIAEPFRWGLIERGDRIGHGIAITLDPKRWQQRNELRVVKVKCLDRLLDLAFLAEYAKGRNDRQDRWLRRETESIIEHLHFESKRKSDPIETAKAVWKAFGCHSTRRLLETPNLCDSTGPTQERWIHSYLWNRNTQKFARDQIPLNVGSLASTLRNERDLLAIARSELISEVAHWQVCIESNPSSNLIVGGFEVAMASQEFLRRRPTEKTPVGKETVTWSISTDDPITFSTTLADEYAYAWAGMVLGNDEPCDPCYARALLDEAAATSMRMRFTIPRHTSSRTCGDDRNERQRVRPH